MRFSANPSTVSLVAIIMAISSWSCSRKSTLEESIHPLAHEKGMLANEGFRRCLNFTEAWLEKADSATFLFPENLYRGNDTWNAHNSAADNYPFMVLTAIILDQDSLYNRMIDILQSERTLTARINSLPDDFLISRKAFLWPELDTGRIIFGASEYIKDGLIPLTEYAGRTPWSERMLEMLDDLSELVVVAKNLNGSGIRTPREDEINGELLQTLSRVYWMTEDDRYLSWAVEIADHYLLDLNLSREERIRLRDHGCEIIAGLSELYLVLHYKDPVKKAIYQPPLTLFLDRILEVARNGDGMFYNEVNLKTGAVLDSGIVDNWGYIYNAYYTIYLLDEKPAYRNAVLKPLDTLVERYHNFNWERGSSDGFADAIEGGINLLNREPNLNLEEWINSEIQVMWSLQDSSYQERGQPWKGSGIIEGWHGDGNFARTTLMYCLWQTCGLTIQPWREDVIFGAVREGSDLHVSLLASDSWEGILKFEGERHREVLQLPMDYPRINQFPEWYTVNDNDHYLAGSGTRMKVSGLDLKKGLEIRLEPDVPMALEIRRIGQSDLD